MEIGTVLAFMLGLGLLFLAFYNGFATEAYSILFGEIVGISTAQVWFTFWTTVIVLGALAVVYRQLLFASLDEEVAEAKGMHTLALGVIFMLALAVAVSIAVTIIGVLLIFALTVTPAAIAIRLAKRPLYVGADLRGSGPVRDMGRDLHRVLRDRTDQFLHRHDRVRHLRRRARALLPRRPGPAVRLAELAHVRGEAAAASWRRPPPAPPTSSETARAATPEPESA